MNMNQDPDVYSAPEIYLRSYENKDELYFEDYCRGLGDPDCYGYPGEEEGEGSGRSTNDPIPF